MPTGNLSIQDMIEGVKRRSLQIELPRSGSYTRSDLAEGLAKCCNLDQIEALGTVKYNNMWEVTFKSKDGADRLLQHGSIGVGHVSGRLTSMDATRVKIRIHWAPHWLPNKAIQVAMKQQLPSTASLEGIGEEKSSIKGLQHVATLVRFAIVKCQGNIADLPHLLRVRLEKEEMELLVTVQGRKPVCLRCHCVGHIRQNCDTPYCVACRGFGHTKEDCRNRFAAAVTGQHSAPGADEEMTEEPVSNETAALVPVQNPGVEAAPSSPEAKEDPPVTSTVQPSDSAPVQPDDGKALVTVPPGGGAPTIPHDPFTLDGSLDLTSSEEWQSVSSPVKKRQKSKEEVLTS